MKYVVIIKSFRKDDNSKDGEWSYVVDSFESAIEKVKKMNDLFEHEVLTLTYIISEIGGDR